jgi:hypothetical protein
LLDEVTEHCVVLVDIGDLFKSGRQVGKGSQIAVVQGKAFQCFGKIGISTVDTFRKGSPRLEKLCIGSPGS